MARQARPFFKDRLLPHTAPCQGTTWEQAADVPVQEGRGEDGGVAGPQGPPSMVRDTVGPLVGTQFSCSVPLLVFETGCLLMHPRALIHLCLSAHNGDAVAELFPSFVGLL